MLNKNNIELNINLCNDSKLRSMIYKNCLANIVELILNWNLKISNKKIKVGILGCGLLGGLILNKINNNKFNIEISVSTRNYEEINKKYFDNIFFYYNNSKLFLESNFLILCIPYHNLDFLYKDLLKTKEKESSNDLIIINLIAGLNSKKLSNILSFYQNIKSSIISPIINYKNFEINNLINYKKNLKQDNSDYLKEYNFLIKLTTEDILNDNNFFKEIIYAFYKIFNKKKTLINKTDSINIKSDKEIYVNKIFDSKPVNYLNDKELLFQFIFPNKSDIKTYKTFKILSQEELFEKENIKIFFNKINFLEKIENDILKQKLKKYLI